MWGPKCSLIPKKTEGQGRSAYPPQPILGSQVRGVNLEKTESGTRPEGGLILKQVAWSQPGEDRGRDKAEGQPPHLSSN